jgi:DNA polymerase
MIEAMGFSRDDVFIANINKCRPPENRKPTREEMDTCLPFLKRQIAILKPKVIIAMGSTAVEGLVPMPEGETISKVRGRWLVFEGIPLMPTYHPAYLLRNPAMKRPVWEDLKAVLLHLGHPIPAVKPESR